MTSNADIINRWAEQVGTDSPRFLRGRGNVLVSDWDSRSIYSYGSHFTLARLMCDSNGNRSWFLLNGDTYSVSTTRHQTYIRAACQRTGLPMVIVSFQALNSAGINIDSIQRVAVENDRYVSTTHHADSIEDVPEAYRTGAVKDADGRYTWETNRHVLGASVFRARYNAERSAHFLSAFDDQESRLHYFLCELPAGSEPTSVEDALTLLRPALVREADAAGLAVTRQGDVFAVPVDLTTREVRKLGESQRRAHVLGLSHTATEVVSTPDGTTYARGTLYHTPAESWRRPEHKRQRMSDGTTWHRIVKNTVPTDARGESRAWSRGGNVD